MASRNSQSTSGVSDNDLVVRVTQNYMTEAKDAKRDRMRLNSLNYDIFHHKQDYSHKHPGQSQEFLPKQQLATEQMASFISQGLVDLGDWFRVEPEPGYKPTLIDSNEIYLLLKRQLEKSDFITTVGDAVKTGAVASLMIVKVHGKQVPSHRFFTQSVVQNGKMKPKLFKAEKNVWQLYVELIRPEDYYPDPTGAGLYECQNMFVDKAAVMALAEGEDAIYDLEKVKTLTPFARDGYDDATEDKDRETDQSKTYSDYRFRVKLTECWGDIIDPSSGEIIHKNVTWTVANDTVLISPPKPNPFWHGKSPFVVSPIVRVPFSVWHRAVMDAPTRHNIALNELYNLMVDAGIMSVFGIKQVRTDWLEDDREVADGVRPGMTLRASANCPPGGKVVERVDTGALSAESLQMFNLVGAEFNQAAMTNDLRMGVMPSRAVKATEVVEASQTITSMFDGIAKIIEVEFIEKILDKAWMTCMQNANDMDSDEVSALLGEQKAAQMAVLPAEERFAQTALGHKFVVYGVSQTLNKQKDFRKLTSLLQTIGSSEVLVEAFIKKYSFEKLLGEIIRSLDVNTAKIEQDEMDQMMMAMGPGVADQGATPLGSTPDMQSQIPQASTGPAQPDIVQSNIPRSVFPPSPAVTGLT